MNSLQNDCTYVVGGDRSRGIVCKKTGEDRRWLHDPKAHQQCIGSSNCYLHEYQPPVLSERTTVSYINIAPDDNGYAAIAQTFLSSVLSDVPAKRRQAVRDQLHQTLTIVGHLAQHGRADLAAQVIAYLDT